MDYIDPKKITYLPNTAGCFTSEDALRTLRLAREIGGWKLVKLEVLGDKKNLFPDMIETLRSTEVLSNEGFKVMAKTLNGGRLFIAGMSLASLAFGLDKCRTYAQEREQFGVPIGSFQRVQDVIIDMDISLEQGLTWLIDLTNRYDDLSLIHI